MTERRGSAARLFVDVVPADDLTAVIAVGEVDAATHLPLARALQRVARDHAGPVIVDLRSLRFMDSTGVDQLLALRRQLGRQARGLSVTCAPGAVHRLFSTLGLIETLNVTCS
jgi:anti-anti-sigma factor